MLLHNQKNAPISWEADGVSYKWEPFGACEVPDQWLEHLRAQNFPVDVSPVPPQAKVEQVSAEERAALESSAIVQLKKKLADAEARGAAAAEATEAAERRETKANEAAAAAEAKVGGLEEQIKLLRSDQSEYEKMVSEANAKAQRLQAELDKATFAGKVAQKSGK